MKTVLSSKPIGPIGHIYCPKDAGLIPAGKGEPMWKAMAMPLHLRGEKCKKCGEPALEHILVIEDAVAKEAMPDVEE